MPSNCFVIGHPIHHSKSPLIHNHWLETLNISGSYEAIDIAPAALEAFFVQLRSGAFTGGNITLPHKEQARHLCDQLSPEAVDIGAVNTVFVKDGRVNGSNTDMYGFLANLDQNAPGWDANNETAIVLGAGGAARAILIGLRRRGFKHIHILNRTVERAQNLVDEFAGPYRAHSLDAFPQLSSTASLLVNTTTIGMHGTAFNTMDLKNLSAQTVVTDIVYTPVMTPLLSAAKAQGLTIVDGLGMLLHQAVPGFEAWFGKRPEVTDKLRQLIVSSLEHN